LPGSLDYHNKGSELQAAAGRKGICRTHELHKNKLSRWGQKAGRTTYEKGVGIFSLSAERRKEIGIANGNRMTASGKIAAIGRAQGLKNARSGHCARISSAGHHKRYHINRGITNPACSLCQPLAA